MQDVIIVPWQKNMHLVLSIHRNKENNVYLG